MALINPQAQLVRLVQPDQDDQFFVYIQSHFNVSNFESDGYSAVSGPDEDGKLKITVKVTTSGTALKLHKTVFHQVPLSGDIVFDDILSSEITVVMGSTTLGTAIVSHDESEVIVKPIP